MLIRPIAESDLRPYIALRLEALRDHPDAFASSYEDQRNDPDDIWLKRIRSSLDGENYRLFLADTGHQLAAMLGLSREPGPKIRHAANLISVYVRPPYRNQHLLDQFLPHILDWCRQHDITLLRLSVTSTNTPAIRCYQRLGFQTTGTLPQYIRTPDGALHDEYLMFRPV